MHKSIAALFVVILLTSCSLAEDVTPPPALATAQAAPVQPADPLIRPTGESAPEAPASVVAADTPPNLFSGASIYAESCEPCHGATGLGDGSMSANLDVPIPALGDLESSGDARPDDWYRVVTEGRMENFMPPFASLSASQRWDVVAYALSLSYPLETREAGADLYREFCAACHGEAGEGTAQGPALNTVEGFARRSLSEMTGIIQVGTGDMPAYGGQLAEGEQLILAAYTQSLATVVHDLVVAEPPAAEEPAVSNSTGSINGIVTNGTAGASLPQDLEVIIVGLDGNVPVLEQTLPINLDGSFSLDGLDITPGRIFGALVEYQDVIYYSVGGHLLDDAPLLELPITIYETTADESSLTVDRLHVIFEFSLEGMVTVSELWLLSTEGDRTIAEQGGQNAIPISLPSGYSNFSYDSSGIADRIMMTDTGFLVQEPVRPDESLEVGFSFTLPYERSLSFIQPIDLPVEAVILLTQSDAPAVSGEGVTDLGESVQGTLRLHNYAMDALEPGSQLALEIRGAHPLQQAGVSTSNLAIGLGVFGVVLIVAGIGFWIWQRRSVDEQDVEAETAAPTPSQVDLLQEIARLDDAYEAGDLSQELYEQERAALKALIMEQMSKDD